jgi:hypothetical protein
MAHIQNRSPVHPDLYEAWVQRAQKAETKIETDAKVIAALKQVLLNLCERDDRNGSLPAAYRAMVDAALAMLAAVDEQEAGKAE